MQEVLDNKIIRHVPTDTWRNNDVIITSKRRRDGKTMGFKTGGGQQSAVRSRYKTPANGHIMTLLLRRVSAGTVKILLKRYCAQRDGDKAMKIVYFFKWPCNNDTTQ